MRTIFYIGWFMFIIITRPFVFLKMKLDQLFCHHKKLMYKGSMVVCHHCGKTILMSLMAIFFCIKGFSQTSGQINVQPDMNYLINIRPTKGDSSFVIKMSGNKLSGNKVGVNLPNPDAIYQLDSSYVFSLGDSVFVVHYFYVSDSTHPYRVGGGYVGKTSDLQKIMGGKSKLKFKNK